VHFVSSGDFPFDKLKLTPPESEIQRELDVLVAMKKTTGFLLSLALASVAVIAHGQVAPSGYEHEAKVRVGGFGSIGQPDYAGNGIAQGAPQPLFGIGAYVDVRANRWLTIESEGRWNRLNEYVAYTTPIGEDTYSIGPKVPIKSFGRITPYGKFLIGFGTATFLNGHATVLSYGGGVDVHLNRRLTLRAGDFEFQQWMLTPNLYPYYGSVGIAYKIF